MTLEQLKAYGADVDAALERCMNNESFYFRLIGLAVADPAFEALGAALAANDSGKAFEEAHKLKGMIANLSLTPIFTPLSELTEPLRRQTPGDYDGLYREALEKKAELVKLLAE